MKPCTCGSGKDRESLHDARGIFCCYVCTKCRAEKERGYRSDVLTNPNYQADEDIYGDD